MNDIIETIKSLIVKEVQALEEDKTQGDEVAGQIEGLDFVLNVIIPQSIREARDASDKA